MNEEANERKNRHEKLIEALREKHRAVLDSRDDEITELKIRLADADESRERIRIDCESLKKQLEKMLDQWRNFKEEAS